MARTHLVPGPGAIVADKYQVLRVIGEGGQGVVVEARHLRLEQRVALKFLRPDLLDDEVMRTRFEREARHASSLQSPFVARIFDVGQTPDRVPFLVAELLEGVALYDEVREHGPLPVEEAVDTIVQACVAIDEAHGLGLVHRDLKPSNIFLVRQGSIRVAKVLDFGISKRLGEAVDPQTALGSVLGSPHCMSPEQFTEPASVDARTDIWSLGVGLFYALTGAYPFDGSGVVDVLAAVTMQSPRELRVLRPEVPPSLEEVVLRTLEKDRTRRFATAKELWRALRPFGSRRAMASLSTGGHISSHPPAESAAATDSLASVTRVDAPVPRAGNRGLGHATTALHGRQADLDALAKLFASGVRLVTLTGPGGVGKTRLAREYGRLPSANDPGVRRNLYPSQPTGSVSIDVVYWNVAGANAATAQTWATSPRRSNPNYGQMQPRIMTANMPVGAPSDQQCGRAVHIDAHVSQPDVMNTPGGDIVDATYPAGCKRPISSADTTFAFFFFDLASCIQKDGDTPQPPPPR